jgi:hypothetical protein
MHFYDNYHLQYHCFQFQTLIHAHICLSIAMDFDKVVNTFITPQIMNIFLKYFIFVMKNSICLSITTLYN